MKDTALTRVLISLSRSGAGRAVTYQ